MFSFIGILWFIFRPRILQSYFGVLCFGFWDPGDWPSPVGVESFRFFFFGDFSVPLCCFTSFPSTFCFLLFFLKSFWLSLPLFFGLNFDWLLVEVWFSFTFESLSINRLSALNDCNHPETYKNNQNYHKREPNCLKLFCGKEFLFSEKLKCLMKSMNADGRSFSHTSWSEFLRTLTIFLK